MKKRKTQDIVVVGEKWQYGRGPTLLLKAKKPARAAYIVSVYVVLDWHGHQSFPGRERIGEMAGCSPDAVSSAFTWLIKNGFLQIQRRPNKTSIYYLYPDASGNGLKPVPEMASSHTNETKA